MLRIGCISFQAMPSEKFGAQLPLICVFSSGQPVPARWHPEFKGGVCSLAELLVAWFVNLKCSIVEPAAQKLARGGNQ
jgi:hypothetical protein